MELGGGHLQQLGEDSSHLLVRLDLLVHLDGVARRLLKQRILVLQLLLQMSLLLSGQADYLL